MKQERQSKRRRFQSKCVWGGWCCDVSSRKGRRSRGKEAGGGSKTTPGQKAPCGAGAGAEGRVGSGTGGTQQKGGWTWGA